MSFQGFLPAPKMSMAGVEIPLNQAMILTFSAVSGNYDSLRYKGAPYVVPAGYKLVIIAAKCVTSSAASGAAVVGSADASVSNSTVPAGYADFDIGGATDYQTTTVATVGSSTEIQMQIEIAAGKYPVIRCTGSTLSGTFLAKLEKV